MSRLVLLDTGPLGLISNPSAKPEPSRAKDWAWRLRQSGVRLVVPEIADYEVRRELLRAGRDRGVERLDLLIGSLDYAAITTAAMRRAARFWADARNAGRPTSRDDALDADLILAAQGSLLAESGREVVIATSNPKHFAAFAASKRWQDVE